MIISISGVPGSGKTSTAKIVAAKLGVPFYSMGGLRGKMAMERGMTIDELNKLGETEAFTDTDVDDYQRELGRKEDNFVVEGRLSWHFIPHSFKVFLGCDPHVAAKRIFDARKKPSEGRGDEPFYASVEEAERDIAARTASDVKRYQTHYGIDYRDPSHYDLIIDTTTLAGPEATAQAILEALKARS